MPKNKIAFALHQTPRGKTIRNMVYAPKGWKLVEFDVEGQESKIMAVQSQDPQMLSAFTQERDFHCNTAAWRAGIEYNEYYRRYKAGEKGFAGPKGGRYFNKMLNLSCNYCIGARSLYIKAIVDYGLEVTQELIRQEQRFWYSLYMEVPTYWEKAEFKARQRGYCETLAGRRYGITKWSGKTLEGKEWAYVSKMSAIMTPIQGTGSDQMELALALVTRKFSEIIFKWSLHDALFFYVRDGEDIEDRILVIKKYLDTIDYKKYWGVALPIKMTWGSAYGRTWGSMREYDKDTEIFK